MKFLNVFCWLFVREFFSFIVFPKKYDLSRPHPLRPSGFRRAWVGPKGWVLYRRVQRVSRFVILSYFYEAPGMFCPRIFSNCNVVFIIAYRVTRKSKSGGPAQPAAAPEQKSARPARAEKFCFPDGPEIPGWAQMGRKFLDGPGRMGRAVPLWLHNV